jgi:hypothetical protein
VRHNGITHVVEAVYYDGGRYELLGQYEVLNKSRTNNYLLLAIICSSIVVAHFTASLSSQWSQYRTDGMTDDGLFLAGGRRIPRGVYFWREIG